jgi:hypothetical protein
MSCHFAGIIEKDDEIRSHVLANRNSFAADAEDILALYTENEEIRKLQQEDAARFQTALQQVGVERVTETNEPIVNMAIRFESNLDLALAAAELGMRPEEFTSKLQSNPTLARVLGVVNAGGQLKRDVFVKVFREAITAFGMGTPVGKVDTPTPDVVATQPPPKNQPAPATPPSGQNGQEEKAADGMRTWTDATGKFRLVAKFDGFDDTKVRLRREDGKVVTVEIVKLSDADQKFVLFQPPDATINLPPGVGEEQQDQPPQVAQNDGQKEEPQSEVGPEYEPIGPLYNKRRRPPRREPPAIPYPQAELREWTPDPDIHDPFYGIFHNLEAGVLEIRLMNGIVLRGPVTDMGAGDQAYLRQIMGDEAYEQQTAPPPGAFGSEP